MYRSSILQASNASGRIGLLAGVALLALTPLAGCEGMIGDEPGNGGSAADGSDADPFTLVCDPETETPPPRRTWLLTAEQMDHTVDHLYNGLDGPRLNFVNNENRTYYGNRADRLTLNSEQVGLLLDQSEEAAQFVSQNLSSYVDCNVRERSCFDEFVDRFATRAWRKPPTQDQIERLRAVYDVGAEISVGEGYTLTALAVLRAPQFIHRTELGAADGDYYRLTPWEVASQLSYLILDGPPDDELMELARTGAILEQATFEQQTQRLMQSSEAQSIASRFMMQLTGARSIIGKAKAPELNADFSPQTRADMMEELRLFSEAMFFRDGATWSDLVLSRETFMNARIAEFYGQSGVQGGDFQRVQIEDPLRSGFLTMPVVMSVHSSSDHVVPTTRGRFVLAQLLCSPLGNPPANASDSPLANPEFTPRERLEAMEGFDQCYACHGRADPIGFAFDHFDAVGRTVTEVYGEPIDDSGEIRETGALDGSFGSLQELIERIANTPEVRACISRKFYEFSQGRPAIRSEACQVEAAQETFEASGGDLSSLLQSGLQGDFLHVRGPGE